jgi:putative aminopeptidase FrvX
MYNKKEQGDLKAGGGPVLCYGPAVQNNLLAMLEKIATDAEIPFQRQAVSRSTGTDTDSFAYAAEGCASALISLPLKYMHTTVETVHKDDVQNVINLIYQVVINLKGNEDFRYLS